MNGLIQIHNAIGEKDLLFVITLFKSSPQQNYIHPSSSKDLPNRLPTYIPTFWQHFTNNHIHQQQYPPEPFSTHDSWR